jgi:3-oxoacyl-[acyl-carrier protein] reductase
MESNAEAPPIALITGGEGDLGRAVRAELETRGWHVLGPGRRELDVSDAASITAFFSGLIKLELLVHCAGVLRDRMLGSMTEEEFDTVLEVNLKGAFRVSQAALKLMAKQRRGHLVFIGSNSARWGTAGQANYAAAKAGLIGLTHSLAREYGARNVRANCILPGLLETKMTAHLSPEVLGGIRAAHTLGRFNTCAEVAKFIAFLHRELPHTSGQVFQLDSRVNRWT